MFTKQSCQHCGTHIEFDADLIDGNVSTVSCPKCQAPVTLLSPPPIEPPPLPPPTEPPPFTKAKRRGRFWIVGIGVTAFVLLILLLVAVMISKSSPAIVPERYIKNKPPTEPLDRYAFGLAVKELNRLFYTTNGFFFVNVFSEVSERPPNIREATDRYVHGERVFYKFWPSTLSDADVMNGWEYRGQFKFLVGGSKRLYDPQKDKGWSEWTMFPGDDDVDISLYGTSLMLGIQKKKGGDWEITQRDNNRGEKVRPLSHDKVEELLKLQQVPSVSR
jgi:hypothetical protein